MGKLEVLDECTFNVGIDYAVPTDLPSEYFYVCSCNSFYYRTVFAKLSSKTANILRIFLVVRFGWIYFTFIYSLDLVV